MFSFWSSYNRDNMRPWAVLLFALLARTFASNESCVGRCENGFDSQRKCQCDSMCKYYKSCCSDYEATCGVMTRGDTFVFAEDDDDEAFEATTPSSSDTNSRRLKPTLHPVIDFERGPHRHEESTLEMAKPLQSMETRLQDIPGVQVTSISETVPPTGPTSGATEAPRTDVAAEMTTVPVTAATTESPDPDAVVCSGRPFDAFMHLKNGSIYAFRGKYFFELDSKSVLPGYPKLIEDVWGITGPIDAAFTRYNCHGKTYIFKGNKYWRFDNGVLDEDYPRDISVGFDTIPDHVDAAFALPAPGYNGREKVYFFKGDQYYTYEFLHQPSHEECITMTGRSPSTLFRRYTDVYYNYERFLHELFSDLPQRRNKHHFIERDWVGLKSPVDAVMTGRMYVPPWRSTRRHYDYRYDQQWDQQWGQQWGQQWDQQRGRRRQNRSPFWGSVAERGMSMGQDLAKKGMELGLRLAEKRMELEERLGRDWDRTWDQDWDQDRRRDGYRQNNRGNYDSRRGRMYWDSPQRYLPTQTVYFFKGDKYYRVDLRAKRVDPAVPPYPRSIAKYWLGCSHTTGAEK